MNSIDGKELISTLMRTCVRMGASAVALISEVWVVESSKRDLEKMKRIALDGDLHLHPCKEERLCVAYNAPDRTITAIAKIHRGHRHFHDWMILSYTAAEYVEIADAIDCPEGRFDNIFARVKR